MSGGESKIQCCKGTWNVRSMNQGKLDKVKQEMARVNIGVLRISELKWVGMGKFNSDDHYVYYCGQESLIRNEIALIINKRVRNAVLGYNLRNNRMISIRFQGKPFNITVIQICAATSNAEEAEVELLFFFFLNCTLNSFVDYEGYSISSKGFLPTVADLMVM